MPTKSNLVLRVIREAECKEMTGLSRVQRWRLEREGLFPARISLGGSKACGWALHEVQQWIQDRMSDRAAQRAA